MAKWIFSLLLILFIWTSCDKNISVYQDERIFSSGSFWNQPIPENAVIDSLSDYYISLLKKEPTGNNFGLNLSRYTVPVYEVDSTTPVYSVRHFRLTDKEKRMWKTDYDFYGHGKEFDAGPVPVPAGIELDPGMDSHLILIDRNRRMVWDMWGAFRDSAEGWVSKTGMKYSMDGDGVFEIGDFDVRDGESIHFYGPGKAAGVPVIAGLIFYNEVIKGEINHKLCCATRFNAYKKHVYPAIWTDGPLEDGIPEGSLIQLDPQLDLSKFDLLPGEMVVARALQKFGMVVVDWAGGSVIPGELLPEGGSRSWNGILREWDGGINSIPLENYRLIKPGKILTTGDSKWFVPKGEIPSDEWVLKNLYSD